MVSSVQVGLFAWGVFAAVLLVPSCATWHRHEQILDMERSCDSIVHMNYPSLRVRMYNSLRVKECRIHFSSTGHQRLMGRFKGVAHRHKHDSCPTDWLKIFDGNRTTDPVIAADGKCNLVSPYECSQNFLTVLFRKPAHEFHVMRWEMVISQFRTTGGETVCEHNEFRCDKNRCIDKRLMCDANYNCNDRTDERSCRGHVSTGAICGIAAGSLIAIVSCIAVCMVLMHKRHHMEDVEVVTNPEAGPLPEKKLPPIDNTAWAMPPAYDAWLPTSTAQGQTWQAAPPMHTLWQPSTPPPEYKPLENEHGNQSGTGNEAVGTAGSNTVPGTVAGIVNKGHEEDEHDKF